MYLMRKILLDVLCSACLLLPSSLVVSGCVDSAVDYEDIDTKLQLNVDGLKVRFGNTERIRLSDMLKPEGNIKVDKQQLYYLVEEGNTLFDFNIKPVSADVDANLMSVKTDLGRYVWEAVMERLPALQRVAYQQQYPSLSADEINKMVDEYVRKVKNGEVKATVSPEVYQGGDYAEFDDEQEFQLNIDWDEAVSEINMIDLKDLVFSLEILLNNETSGSGNFNPSQNFLIKGLKDVVITLPPYIKASNIVDGQIRIKDYDARQQGVAGVTRLRLENVTVDRLEFAKALRHGEKPTGKFKIAGKINLGIQRAFEVQGAPSGHISLLVAVNGKERDKVQALSVKGKFAPKIEPDIAPIAIKSEVPEFLLGDDVKLNVNDITLRLDADLSQIPAGIQLRNGLLLAQRAGQPTSVVVAPEGVSLERGKKSTLYFHQGKQPWDVEPIAEDAKRSQVADFNRLVERIPDQVQVKLGDGAVKLEEATTTVELGKNYAAAIAYKLFVPFSFNAGMSISYTEESDPIDLDSDELSLTDNTIEVTAKALSTIPFDLDATVIPLDEEGRALSGVKVNVNVIKGAANNQVAETPLKLTLVASNPDLLRQLHKIKFAVKASAGTDIQGAQLRSDQYLQLQDARIKVSGKVIADFN